MELRSNPSSCSFLVKSSLQSLSILGFLQSIHANFLSSVTTNRQLKLFLVDRITYLRLPLSSKETSILPFWYSLTYPEPSYLAESPLFYVPVNTILKESGLSVDTQLWVALYNTLFSGITGSIKATSNH